MRGRIKWFDPGKGFGWVTIESGEELYFSAGCLAEGVAAPAAGDRVELDVLSGPSGKIAIHVRPAEDPRGRTR